MQESYIGFAFIPDHNKGIEMSKRSVQPAKQVDVCCQHQRGLMDNGHSRLEYGPSAPLALLRIESDKRDN